MFCPRCGQQMPDHSQFCLRCGQPLGAVNQALGPPGSAPAGWQGYPPNGLPAGGYGQGQNWPAPTAQQQYPAQPQQRPPADYGGNLVPPTRGQNPAPHAEPKKKKTQDQASKKTQVPDPTFSKFVDAPDPPLPFFIPKIIIGIISILGAALLLWQCNELGTFRLIAGHAKDNIPGMALLFAAVLLIVAGITSAASKMSKGAAGTAAVFYFFVLGVSLTKGAEFEYAMVYTICSAIFAMVNLVSAAGGVHINLDD